MCGRSEIGRYHMRNAISVSDRWSGWATLKSSWSKRSSSFRKAEYDFEEITVQKKPAQVSSL